ncbi:uncharacterized protein LOC143537864 [Bidens hawaiensis]|uniref:uncharacterized protein LOC143537864 n=1 Tax=Bidens hawaiensis TaxID=980011 RepID=UPI00404A3400
MTTVKEEALEWDCLGDYFNDFLKYKSPKDFRYRFWMCKSFFFRITEDLEHGIEDFKKKSNGRWTIGFTTSQKCTSTVHVLAYGNKNDFNNEYLNMAEKQLETPWRIIKLYVPQYLRTPDWNDLQWIYEPHQRHIPGKCENEDKDESNDEDEDKDDNENEDEGKNEDEDEGDNI